MRMLKAVQSNVDCILFKITPHYIDPPIGGYHGIRCSVLEKEEVVALFVHLPARPMDGWNTPGYFYVTWIAFRYYACWPDSERWYQCTKST